MKRKNFLLILILFLNLINFISAHKLNPKNNSNFDDVYAEGKAVFYRIVQIYSQWIPLEQKDREKLLRAEKTLSGLYEHLMSFYYFVAQLEQKDAGDSSSLFLEISSKMAKEFLQSIPRRRSRKDMTPLAALVTSTGYYSRKHAPQFRRWLRPIPRSYRGQWALSEFEVRDIHALYKGKGIRMAIVDTGIDPTIKEMRVRTKVRKNLLDRSKPKGEKGKFPYDWEGHGTSVASLAHQIAPEAELMIIKFYEEETMNTVPPSRWTGYLMAAGVIWAVQNGADIINLSSAYKLDNRAMEAAARLCWENNVILITPMGNAYTEERRNDIFFPASYPWTIAVGGVEKHKEGLSIWRYSTFGNYVDVSAPARELRVEVPSYRGMRRLSRLAYGTSMATSFVSGASALILSALDEQVRRELKAEPGKLFEIVRGILRQTASNESLGLPTPNPVAGYGLINIAKAIDMAEQISDGETDEGIFDF